MTNTELYRLALSTYGAEAQTLMVMEEMSELQKELCKHARGKDNQLSIAEEIADVLIMLDQMMILHDCESIVAQYKQEKLERLENRIAVSYTHLDVYKRQTEDRQRADRGHSQGNNERKKRKRRKQES